MLVYTFMVKICIFKNLAIIDLLLLNEKVIMSFTSTVKNELSKLELEQVEKISLLSAILKNSATL